MSIENEIAKQMLSAFVEGDKDIPDEDLKLLEEAFINKKVWLGGTFTLPNGVTYKCMAIGWKKVEENESSNSV